MLIGPATAGLRWNACAHMIGIKRVYDKPAKTDGYRVLIDRLWPRGLKRGSARIDAWLKEAAPSDRLRRWFKHDPAKWREFRRRYQLELQAHPESWAPIVARARHGNATLLYGARDVEHNNAVVLREFVNAKLKESSRCRSNAR